MERVGRVVIVIVIVIVIARSFSKVGTSFGKIQSPTEAKVDCLELENSPGRFVSHLISPPHMLTWFCHIISL